ncbi:MAG: DJ-1/PfpI family protein [Deltaproteobacteria bacterium]|jgi:4-methyl-5(b-hydroxyethyl)-thiazole monophosphate biosynthesis|nr:DJ-1/PfpI family protein [Deltaproteobacteria bacterium]
MARAAVFIIDGFEEIEAVSVIDLLRRGGVETETVSLEPGLKVQGRHQIALEADRLLDGLKPDSYDILILPGGTIEYVNRPPFLKIIAERAASGRRLAAICAAPAVLGRLGILKGKKAVCYPGFEKELAGAEVETEPVLTDGFITTSRGPGTAPLFALEILRLLVSQEVSDEVRRGILLS